MIPNDFVQTLLARVDIVDVIDRMVPLRKAGANYQACCPFHSEKTPSFTVSPTKQFYHCFGCGAHGTAIGFLMNYAGKSFPESVETLARDAGLTVPHIDRPGERERREQATDLAPVLLAAAKFYRAQLKDAEVAIDYLKRRGLTGPIAARFGIGYAPDARQALASAFDSYHQDLISLQCPVKELERGAPYLPDVLKIIFSLVPTDSYKKSIRGDYINVSMQGDFTYSSLDNALLTGTGLSGVLRALEQSFGHDPELMIPDVRYTPNPNSAPGGPLVERGDRNC